MSASLRAIEEANQELTAINGMPRSHERTAERRAAVAWLNDLYDAAEYVRLLGKHLDAPKEKIAGGKISAKG